ncbi:unnamed protein product [Mytilus coruscus]|uniref:NFX1-type zinc finger-containing protein 1 n=1 Tax=Mytilus coruscus TaxID=42192 RepID=A0A6J8ESA8_MYTCO|nr:unnamed protein product [Mytilus coruscus]
MKKGPQITIIEEAAEVIEAHIVTAINPACEHLIFIGDHKHLEPKHHYVINNGIPYTCLQRQHKMRPEISELMRHMYPKLYDNENVLEYDNIKGIRQNMYFITHDYHEQYNGDGKSFSNEHEAEYVEASSTLTKKSKGWQTVVQKIKSNNKANTNHAYPKQDCGTSFGKALPLYCQNHPEQDRIMAELLWDFDRAPEGGCALFCELRLECRHVCRLRCHPFDKDHKEYECRTMCPKVCKDGHKCKKRCHFPKNLVTVK